MTTMPHFGHTLLLKFRVWAAVAVLSLGFSPASTFAQVVASGITGRVVDEAGRPIANADVTAVHIATNTTSREITRDNGRFSFRGLPVGGPFTVTATVDNVTIESVNGVQTILGENVDIQLSASSHVQVLEELIVQASATDLDPDSSGPSSVLSSAQL